MKTKFSLLLALSAFLAIAADFTYLPELKPVTIEWDHDRRWSSDRTFYKLYFGTNLVQQITTNDFTQVRVNPTNNLPVFTAKVIFGHEYVGPDATNKLTITAYDPVPAIESDPSTNVWIGQVVGKPLPPQGSRKP